MSAAIAALASYGGSDSEPDSEPEAEGGSQRAAVLASRDAVLHLRAPTAAPPALAVDAAPEVAVKVGVPPPPGGTGARGARPPLLLLPHCRPPARGRTALGQPPGGKGRVAGRAGAGLARGTLPPPGLALPGPAVWGPEVGREGLWRGARPADPTVAVKRIKAYYFYLKTMPRLQFLRYSCLLFARV